MLHKLLNFFTLSRNQLKYSACILFMGKLNSFPFVTGKCQGGQYGTKLCVQKLQMFKHSVVHYILSVSIS